MISQDLRNLRRGLHEAAAEDRLYVSTFRQALAELDRLADEAELLEATLVPPPARAVADGDKVVDLARRRRPASPGGPGSAA